MKKDLSRRQFLHRTAGAAGALAASPAIFLEPEHIPLPLQSTPASDRLRFGIIGIGMQGSGLLRDAIQLPGVECVAACDLYDGRHTLAQEIVGKKIPTTRRYKDLLDNKEIDCLIAAVPDHWHKQVVVDAVSAGKDIYCEKPMSHSAADGVAMVAAAQKTGRVVQIGSQRVSSVICAKAKELLANGVIGTLTLVEGSLGRNDPTGAWVYPPPPDLSLDNFDWDTWQGDATKRPWDPDMSPNSPSLISRNPAKTNLPAITSPAIHKRCAMPISRNGTRSTTPSPARNPSGRDSAIAALPGMKKNLTSGDFSRARATISKSLK